MNNVDKKSKEDLLKEFLAVSSHNTLRGEQYAAAIMVKSVSDIQGSISEFNRTVKSIGESSDALSNKLFWLNLILVAATILGAIATFKSAFLVDLPI